MLVCLGEKLSGRERRWAGRALESFWYECLLLCWGCWGMRRGAQIRGVFRVGWTCMTVVVVLPGADRRLYDSCREDVGSTAYLGCVLWMVLRASVRQYLGSESDAADTSLPLNICVLVWRIDICPCLARAGIPYSMGDDGRTLFRRVVNSWSSLGNYTYASGSCVLNRPRSTTVGPAVL